MSAGNFTVCTLELMVKASNLPLSKMTCSWTPQYRTVNQGGGLQAGQSLIHNVTGYLMLTLEEKKKSVGVDREAETYVYVHFRSKEKKRKKELIKTKGLHRINLHSTIPKIQNIQLIRHTYSINPFELCYIISLP